MGHTHRSLQEEARIFACMTCRSHLRALPVQGRGEASFCPDPAACLD
jgi:hypothetical protein